MNNKYIRFTLSTLLAFIMVFSVSENLNNTVFANNNQKVAICHRTNSTSNPYVKINIDTNAADGVAGNSGQKPDHYGEHQGPLASSESAAQSLKNAKIEWGDIIPPISPYHNGLNWSAEGQAIFYNGCNYSKLVSSPSPSPWVSPSPSPSPTPSPSPSPSPSPDPECKHGCNEDDPDPSPTPNPSSNPSPSPNPSSSPTPTPDPSPTPASGGGNSGSSSSQGQVLGVNTLADTGNNKLLITLGGFATILLGLFSLYFAKTKNISI